MKTGRTAPCARCTRTRPIMGRGLCTPCFETCCTNRTLDQYPRVNYRKAELIEEAEFLIGGGCTADEAAARLGVTAGHLKTTLRHHRREQVVNRN